MSTPRAASSSAIAARTRSAVPTGTVDLSTTTLNSVIRRPMLRAAASTYCMSAEPSSSGGVPTAMNCSAPCATAASWSVVKRRRPAATLRAIIASRPGSWIGTPPCVQDLDLARVDVEAQHVVADLGEAGAGDEADVARPDHRDLHARAPSDALMAASAATGSGACVIGRPITR